MNKIKIDSSWKKGSKKKYLVLLLPVIALLYFLIFFDGAVTLGDDDLITDTVQQSDLELNITGFGTFGNSDDELLTLRVAGLVTDVYLYPGDSVDKGQLILKLSNDELSFELTGLSNELGELELLAKEQLAEADLKVKQTINQVKKAELMFSLAERKLQSSKKLRKKGIVSEVSFLQHEADYQESMLEVGLLKDTLKQMIDKQKTTKEIYGKKKNVLQNKIDNLSTRLSELSVRSPKKGLVKQMELKKGDHLAAGSLLAVIGSDRPNIASLKFPQKYLNMLENNRSKEVKITYPFGNISAKLRRIDPQIIDGYAIVEAEFNPNEATKALVNMNLQAEIAINKFENVIYVEKPSYYSNQERFVYVLNKNKLDKTKIDAEVVDGKYLIVKSGLEIGMEVLLSDHQELSGNKVVKFNER